MTEHQKRIEEYFQAYLPWANKEVERIAIRDSGMPNQAALMAVEMKPLRDAWMRAQTLCFADFPLNASVGPKDRT